MELQPRDLAILETVGDLGTADTEILHELHFPADTTGRACQQRLRKICQAGLLTRVRLIASDRDLQSGSLPMLHFLTEDGADLIEQETGQRPLRVTRSDPKPFTLRHRMATVRARLAIDRAAERAGLPSPQWIMEQDTHSGVKRSKDRSPSDYLILHNRFDRDGRKVTFRPDAACHLQIPRPSGGYQSVIAYLEVDRSTEGHQQWQRKLVGIEAFLNDAKAWSSHWPQVTEPIVRVFVLCLSEQRITNLAETTRPSSAAKGIRFTTHPLDPDSVLTGDIWRDCHGKLFRVIK